MTIIVSNNNNFKNGIISSSLNANSSSKSSITPISDAAFELENVEVLNDGSIKRRAGLEYTRFIEGSSGFISNFLSDDTKLFPLIIKKNNYTIFAVGINSAYIFYVLYDGICKIICEELPTRFGLTNPKIHYYNICHTGKILLLLDNESPKTIELREGKPIAVKQSYFSSKLGNNISPTSNIEIEGDISLEVIAGESLEKKDTKTIVRLNGLRTYIKQQDIDSYISINNYSYLLKIITINNDYILTEAIKGPRPALESEGSKITQISIPSFGSYFGYPTLYANFDSRAFYSGIKKRPTTIWISKVKDPFYLEVEDQFKSTTESAQVVKPDEPKFEDPKTITINASENNEKILHLITANGFFIFTNKNIYKLVVDYTSPAGYSIIKLLAVSCDENITPIFSLNKIYFVSADKKKLYQLSFVKEIIHYNVRVINSNITAQMKKIWSISINDNNDLITVINTANECFHLRISKHTKVFAWYKTSIDDGLIMAHCNFLDQNIFLSKLDIFSDENQSFKHICLNTNSKYCLDFEKKSNPYINDNILTINLGRNTSTMFSQYDIILGSEFIPTVQKETGEKKLVVSLTNLPLTSNILRYGKSYRTVVRPRLNHIISAKNRSIDGYIRVRKVNLNFESQYKIEFIISQKKYFLTAGKIINDKFVRYRGKKSFVVFAKYARDLDKIFLIDTYMPYDFKINYFNLEINYN